MDVKNLRAIIPVAGNGLRLRPITETKPKALIEVAGKPVLDHILRNLSTSSIDELILIVGHMKQAIIDWAQKNYSERFTLRFIEQKEKLGLGHAISCAHEYMDQNPLLISLGDEIFEVEYSKMIDNALNKSDAEASIGIKEVDEPESYGMIRFNTDGTIKEMIEKPKKFDGRLAIAGVYIVKQGTQLREALQEILHTKSGGKEYQLTDALQLMITKGTTFSTFEVGEWYDCGRFSTLLSSNRRLLQKARFGNKHSGITNTDIIEPCHIGLSAKISDSKVGPNVSIGEHVSINNCSLSNVIVESNSTINGRIIEYGIISGEKQLLEES
jgi:glucose-1-phosphate thymidylyltransferase